MFFLKTAWLPLVILQLPFKISLSETGPHNIDTVHIYSNSITLLCYKGARLDTCLPGMRMVAGSIFTSGKTSFIEIWSWKISTTILSLPLIQEGQLSVTGEMMGTKYW